MSAQKETKKGTAECTCPKARVPSVEIYGEKQMGYAQREGHCRGSEAEMHISEGGICTCGGLTSSFGDGTKWLISLKCCDSGYHHAESIVPQVSLLLPRANIESSYI